MRFPDHCEKCRSEIKDGNLGYGLDRNYFCKKCVSENSLYDLVESLEYQLNFNFEHAKRWLANTSNALTLLNSELVRLKKYRKSYLVEVTSEFTRSNYKQEQLKREILRQADSHHRNLRSITIERLWSSDRRATLEVSFHKNSHFKVVLLWQNEYRESLIPKYDKFGVKRFIDHTDRPRIPWKEILSGKTWSSEINLSPYFIYDLMVPNNLVPFKRKA